MTHLHWLEYEIRVVVRQNRYWMLWHLTLASIPAALALGLFRRGPRRGPLWWTGVVLFTLFLPNAPYVVSDLKYLHSTMVDAASRGVALAGVLPMFAAYIAAGMLLYWLAAGALAREVVRWRPRLPAEAVVLTIHLCSAVGVLIGRDARLNSWNAITAPRATVRLTLASLTAARAPGDLATALVAIALGYGAIGLGVQGVEAVGARLAVRMQQWGGAAAWPEEASG